MTARLGFAVRAQAGFDSATKLIELWLGSNHVNDPARGITPVGCALGAS